MAKICNSKMNACESADHLPPDECENTHKHALGPQPWTRY